MGEDAVEAGERKLRERLRRKRAGRGQRDVADEAALVRTPDADEDYSAFDPLADADPGSGSDFGYSGWSVTLDAVPMPEAQRTSVTPDASPGRLKRRLRARNASSEPQSAALDYGEAPFDDDQNELPLQEEPDAYGEPAASDSPRQPLRAQRRVDPDLLPKRKRGEGGARAARARRRKAETFRAADEDVDRPIIAAPTPRSDPSFARSATPAPSSPRARRQASRLERSFAEPDPPADPRGDTAGARKRRHKRIAGGGTVMVGNDLYPLVDWSMGGIAIASDQQRFRVGERKTLELEIDLVDYAVNLDLEADVVNRNAERTGFQFVNLSQTQKELLRGLTQAALKNNIFAAPGASRRAGGTVNLKPAPSKSVLWREFRPFAALMSFPFNAAVIALVAGVAILTLRTGDAPDRPLAGPVPGATLRAEHAAVAVERLALQSEVAGVVLEWGVQTGQAVEEGEALVSVGLSGGDEGRTVLTAPCDCFLARILAVPGQRIEEGTIVGLLYRSGTEGHVQALFPSGSAPNLGDPVTVALPYSGDRYSGVVESVGRLDDPNAFIGLPSAIVQSGENAVFTRIRTTPSVPPALAGDPAIVTVRPEA
ncbi:MAG: PilZ domain-containing protein [Pseudomonadota bacterium]